MLNIKSVCVILLAIPLIGFFFASSPLADGHRMEPSPILTKYNLERWRNVQTRTVMRRAINSCRSDFQPQWRTMQNKKVKVGPAYQMVVDDAGLLRRASDLILSPTHTVSQRRFFAFNLDEVSIADWTNLRTEIQKRNEPTEFSMLVGNGRSFLATPVKWNTHLADSVQAAMSATAGVAGAQKDAARALAASLVSESVNWTSTHATPRRVQIDFHFAPSANNGGCDYVVRLTNNSQKPKTYVALSYMPEAFSALDATEVITHSGIAGQALGAEYPSWPTVDTVSVYDSQGNEN